MALVLTVLALAAPIAAGTLEDLLWDLQLVPLEGPAPAFELTALDGARVSLADFRGRPVLLYFWLASCPYCTQELPSVIEQVRRDYEPRGLAVLAVNIEEDRAIVAAWVRVHKVTSRVLLDPTGAANRAYRVIGTPTVFLIGRDGHLVAKAISTRPWTGETGRSVFQALLAR